MHKNLGNTRAIPEAQQCWKTKSPHGRDQQVNLTILTLAIGERGVAEITSENICTEFQKTEAKNLKRFWVAALPNGWPEKTHKYSQVILTEF